ncbi:enoyl-CoA hydratase/isomerase family protein [Ramlibacter sp. PS4R-6]|uniref:enoyl-CoA hydratase/isomerase family protein n=1 Tax=Ramlibacter sp. PS4R-6 TaxID=3133438 RepID=UPI0030A5AB32
MSDVIVEIEGRAALITLNRPKALNALTLDMIRQVSAVLLACRDAEAIEFVALRGMGKDGPFGNLCAGGDLRFFHEAVLSGNPELEDFFTEEYELNYLVNTFPKPYAVFMDGIVMGGGMGISGHARQGATLRIVTERTKMAMPETNVGLFPDVGGGWFLSRCPGHIGEYLALTGTVIGGADALYAGLADALVPSEGLPSLWESIAGQGVANKGKAVLEESALAKNEDAIERFFSLPTVGEIVAALEGEASAFARETAAMLRQRSPLMLHVVLEHLRRARTLSLADDLRLERNMIRRSFHLRPGTASETMEGIRATVIDKDRQPRWNPARIEDVTPAMVQAFFDPPWPAYAHPLRDLA